MIAALATALIVLAPFDTMTTLASVLAKAANTTLTALAVATFKVDRSNTLLDTFSVIKFLLFRAMFSVTVRTALFE